MILRSAILLLILAASFIFPADSSAEIKVLSSLEGKWPVDIEAEDDFLYTLDYGFRVWDITDPKNIRKIGQYDKAKDAIWQAKPDFIKYEEGYGNPKGGGGADYGGYNQIRGMGIGNFEGRKLAFIRCAHQGIQVLDVTDPAHIFNMGGRPDLRKNIEVADNAGKRIKVKGENIFRTYWDGFQIFRYSSVAALKNMGPYEYVSEIKRGGFGGAANDIKISEGNQYVYIAADNTMDVYDISNVWAPICIYTYNNIRRPYQKIENKGICVATGNNLLFLGTSKDLRIFDISDMRKIKTLTDAAGKEVIYPSSGSVLDIKIYKNYAFLYYGPTEVTKSSPETGLEIVDISDPREPKFVDAFILGKTDRTDVARKMALIPKKGIVIIGVDAFYVLDVSDYIK
jgi:hypothetical protein